MKHLAEILPFQKPDSLFGGDPFAPKSPSRPSIGPKSPVPALPPKQKKQPPPRPAPPKNRPTPSPSQQLGDFDSDPFAGLCLIFCFQVCKLNYKYWYIILLVILILQSLKPIEQLVWVSKNNYWMLLFHWMTVLSINIEYKKPFFLAGNDPFASSATTSSDDAFANFADFSPSKVSFHSSSHTEIKIPYFLFLFNNLKGFERGYDLIYLFSVWWLW